MLERLVENWLDSANERSFQGPFCQMLASEGYTIVHITRHSEMEMGKDVIAVAPNGALCAYQLKTVDGPRITISQWRNNIQSQVLSLVTQQIVHPSVAKDKPHHSFLVTNRDIDEPVQRSIEDMNLKWRRTRPYRFGLKTIVRGQMLQMAARLQSGLWPTEPGSTNSLLHMFLANGRGSVPLPRLAALIEGTLALNTKSRPMPRRELKRRLASAALLCSVALSNYSLAGNHVREVEGLSMLISYILAHAERHRLDEDCWRNEFNVAADLLYDRLMTLLQELTKRSHLIEGEPWSDTMFLRARATMCVGYMSILGLWRTARKMERDSTDDQIRDFCEKYQTKLEYWGESATPFFLALFWYLEKNSGSIQSDLLVRDLLSTICTLNKPGSQMPLPTPYYGYEEIIEHQPVLGGLPIRDSFAGRSQSATALLHLLVRRNLKQSAKALWPDYTRIMHEEHIPTPKWRFHLWRDKDGGINRMVHPPLTKQWNDLRAEAFDEKGRMLPRLIRSHPVLLLLTLCVYPHRLTAEVVRWLDAKLGHAWR